MCSSRGNVRVPLSVGRNGRKIGRARPSASLFGTEPLGEGPRSYSCQSYVTVSPFRSVEVAVRAKGVCFGMLKAGPPTTETDGGVFPLGVVTGQEFPCPVWL